MPPVPTRRSGPIRLVVSDERLRRSSLIGPAGRPVAAPHGFAAWRGGGGHRCYGRSAVRISHKVDYGVRVMTTLARASIDTPGRAVSSTVLAQTDGLPPGFLDDILRLLRNGGLLRSQRGGDGGWLLARPAEAITVADVIRSLEGPLASVRGVRPHELADNGESGAVRVAVDRRAGRAAVRARARHAGRPGRR